MHVATNGRCRMGRLLVMALEWYSPDTALDDKAIGKLWQFYRQFDKALGRKMLVFLIEERRKINHKSLCFDLEGNERCENNCKRETEREFGLGQYFS